jgi:hypothetical protein
MDTKSGPAMRQRTARPIKKVVAGGISGATLGPALTVLVVYLFGVASHGTTPPEVQTAIGVICTWVAFALAAYMIPADPADAPVAVP